MPFTLRTTEPHPTVHPHTKLLTGRGGAGNFIRPPPPHALPSTTSHRNPPLALSKASSTATTHSASPHPHRYATGRGGAGNYHDAAERPMFKFDEELERERRAGEHVPVYHVGRGGMGNLVDCRRRDSSGSERSSESSEASTTWYEEWNKGFKIFMGFRVCVLVCLAVEYCELIFGDPLGVPCVSEPVYMEFMGDKIAHEAA
ncbi:MAG: hypothetical protein LQ342_002183 [Letrouitia transgressa]|nr:MAG: hypothetical protein LQ342_002183 [Letrouitia transgressa]